MFDKLLVRVRSWLHAGPQPAGAGAGTFPAGDYRGIGGPPPLPPDAWMESESGMVITESGIIIIDPALADAGSAAPPPPPRGVPADRAWAMPTLPTAGGSSTAMPATTAAAARSVTPNEELDWDEVLARARANIARPAQAGGRETPRPEPRAAQPEAPPARNGRANGRKK